MGLEVCRCYLLPGAVKRVILDCSVVIEVVLVDELNVADLYADRIGRWFARPDATKVSGAVLNVSNILLAVHDPFDTYQRPTRPDHVFTMREDVIKNTSLHRQHLVHPGRFS